MNKNANFISNKFFAPCAAIFAVAIFFAAAENNQANASGVGISLNAGCFSMGIGFGDYGYREPAPVVVAEPAPVVVAEPAPVVVAPPAPRPVVVAPPAPRPVVVVPPAPRPVVVAPPAPRAPMPRYASAPGRPAPMPRDNFARAPHRGPEPIVRGQAARGPSFHSVGPRGPHPGGPRF